MDPLIFIGAIAALVILHELGHFIVAKLMKVGVDEFGLGFPPRLARLFTFKGTEYTLNWIPLGGFVRLRGETDPDIPGGFLTAKPLARIAILLGGPLANILTAILLYAIAFTRVGLPDTSQVVVMNVVPETPAATAGLLSGDVLLRINTSEVDSTLSVQEAVQSSLDQPTTIIVDRDGETLEFSLVPRSNPPEGQGAIGIEMGNPTQPINVIQALPYGVTAVGNMGYTFLTLPVQVAQGAIAPEDARLVGFKGMYDIFQEVRETETSPAIPAEFNLLAFFAMISTSLGVLNLLPIPALDGGRILFTLPELLFGKRIPHRLENAVNAVSFMLLLGLLVYINLQDFINPIQLTP